MIHGTLSLQELSLFALHVEFWVRHYGQVVLSFRPINHLSSHSFQNNASVSTFQMPKWELYPSSLVANLAIPASYVLLSNIYDMHPRGHDTVDILLLLMKKKRRRKSIVIIGCLFAHVHCMCCVVCVCVREGERGNHVSSMSSTKTVSYPGKIYSIRTENAWGKLQLSTSNTGKCEWPFRSNVSSIKRIILPNLFPVRNKNFFHLVFL